MALIQSFRDLEVYQLSRTLAQKLFAVTKKFPSEEKYSMTDQMRRSSRAVGAMIAEAWGRRRYLAAFINKMDEALAEAMETQSWLDHALDCMYLDTALHQDLDAGWQRVGAMLNRVIERAATFCTATQGK